MGWKITDSGEVIHRPPGWTLLKVAVALLIIGDIVYWIIT